MDKHIIEINLGTKYNSNLKKEIIPLNVFTLQQIIEFINEDTNYIYVEKLLNLWFIFKIELQKYKISPDNKISFIITTAQVKRVQNIVTPFKDMMQDTMDRYNSIYRFSQQITDPTEMADFLVKYKGKEQQNLLPYTYQDFLLEKAHQIELERITEMEQWRIEDEARRVHELEVLKDKELTEQEAIKEQETVKEQEAIKEQEDYDKLCLEFYKKNIKNKSNKYCLFHIHPYKECNMEGTGKKCGFRHEYPPLKVLKECKKCMRRSNSK